MRLHADEIEIDEPLVRALLGRAVPQLADRPLRRLDATGSSNALFGLGDDLVVRLPRQPGGSAAIAKEARWLPHLAAALPVAVPEIVAVGPPGFGYPEHWSIARWIEGATPEVHGHAGDIAGNGADGDADSGLAIDLADVVATLRELPVPSDAVNDPDLRWYRGEPLARMDPGTRRDLAACRSLPGLDLDIAACERVWDAAMLLPETGPDTPHWLHGDLLGENLLVRGGRLAAVLDFGALAVGDPTVDLIAGWDVLAPPQRVAFRAASGVDDHAWLRGRAWALAIAVMTFPYYWHTMPARCDSRLALARSVLDDAVH